MRGAAGAAFLLVGLAAVLTIALVVKPDVAEIYRRGYRAGQADEQNRCLAAFATRGIHDRDARKAA